ncbi:MAG: 6-bladed beta-propeller [Myxococcota bacterium]
MGQRASVHRSRSRAPHTSPALRVGLAALWGLGLWAAIACARPPSPRAWDAPGESRVWPAGPDPGRIEYVGALQSGEDLGRPRGLLERLVRGLAGAEPDRMLAPLAVAVTPSGLLVVADPGVPTLHFFDLGRRRYDRLDADAARTLRSPVGVAVADGGRTFVSDSALGRVFVFDADRRRIGDFGAGVLQRPTGLALDPSQDHLYVVDTLACQVVVFDVAGRPVRRFGERGTGPGQFNGPTHIAIAPDGTIAISDSLNFRVQVFHPDGTLSHSVGRPGDVAGSFARPKGVGFDSFGNLYVVDAAFENVQIFGPEGALLLAFGHAGGGIGGFSLPAGIAIDDRDRIWVADSFNQRVQVFRLRPGPR